MKTIEMIMYAKDLKNNIQNNIKSKNGSPHPNKKEKHLVLISDFEKEAIQYRFESDAFFNENADQIMHWETDIIKYIDNKGIKYEPLFDEGFDDTDYYMEFIIGWNFSFEQLTKTAKEIIDEWDYDIITLKMLCDFMKFKNHNPD